MTIELKNLLRVLFFGWKESGTISSRREVENKGRLSIYFDMIKCVRKYQILSSQYSYYKLNNLTGEEREIVCCNLKEQNKKRDKWEAVYNENWRFLNKYTKFSWETSNRKRQRRAKAYIKHFGLGKKCWVQYDVKFICEHFSVGELKVGENVLFARGCDIDYTGDLTIGRGCLLSENVKILTHNHDYLDDHALVPTPLKIGEDVIIGARVLVLPGVKSIGRGAMLSAGAVVKYEVPPYAVVVGNPAKIVGFRFTPEQIMEYEEDLYPERDRLTEDELVANHKKYFLDRVADISYYLR